MTSRVLFLSKQLDTFFMPSPNPNPNTKLSTDYLCIEPCRFMIVHLKVLWASYLFEQGNKQEWETKPEGGLFHCSAIYQLNVGQKCRLILQTLSCHSSHHLLQDNCCIIIAWSRQWIALLLHSIIKLCQFKNGKQRNLLGYWLSGKKRNTVHLLHTFSTLSKSRLASWRRGCFWSSGAAEMTLSKS